MEPETLINALEWRYATSIFDKTKTIPEDKLQTILEAANLTATSFGIQPFKLILLEGKLWREKLESATFHQKNIQTCSHLLVLAHRTDVNENYVEDYTRFMENIRQLEPGTLVGFLKSCTKFINSLEEDFKKQWLSKQLYTVCGNLMTSCAVLGIDACPMEGFNAKLVDEILNLEEKNLASVLLFPMGYRSDEDKYARIPKIRKPLDEMVIRM